MDEQPPLPVRRYLVAGLIAAAAISGLLLLVRPILFSFAPPLDDSNYNVAAAAEAAKGPLLVEIVLNESHAIPGEVHRDQRVGLTVVVAPVVVAPGAADAFTAVDAWSPTHDCPVTLGADRLVDCAGDT